MKTILVVGGAGYIGSHMINLLGGAGFKVVCFDNLSTGFQDAIKYGDFYKGDINSPEEIEKVFDKYDISAVFDFAAKISVGESVAKPIDYYRNNVAGTLNLLKAMRNHGVEKIIFSSTAAVYGNPETELIKEDHPLKPINPYGYSKQMIETILSDCVSAEGISSVRFRYFNAAGASLKSGLGERHEPETHLIPLVIKSVLEKESPALQIFGDDYPTPDGTCVRDYIHVEDLCSAHLLGLEYLPDHPGTHVFNLGNGHGFSVREVIQSVEEITGKKVTFEISARRPGDAPILVADSGRAKSVLGWKPKFVALNDIVRSAWEFHKQGN